MKRINLFAGVLFVLAGFCASVGFSLYSSNVQAQGRTDPPAALKTVERVRYLENRPDSFIRMAKHIGTTLYFPADPIRQIAG